MGVSVEFLGLLAVAFGLGLSGALMPGPLTTISFAESAKRGWLASVVVVTGHGIAETVMVVALALGLSQLLKLTVVMSAIGIVGGAFLIWMGAGMLRSVRDGSVLRELAAATRAPGAGRRVGAAVATETRANVLSLGLITTGALVSISNPYWLMWWATAGSKQLTDALVLGALGPVVFLIGHVLSDFGWNGLLAVAADSGRRFLNDRIYSGIIAVCAVFVAVVGVWFIYDGFDRWLGIAVWLHL